MDFVVKTMMELIRSEIFGVAISGISSDVLSNDFYEKLYKLSKSHDLVHIVGSALKNNGLMPQGDIAKKFEKQTFMALLRYERLNYEYEQICNTFEKNNIVYVPLKGAVIRDFYPEPWMRTSCDIDILVRENDVDKAIESICGELGYTSEEKNYHDVSMHSNSGIHLELHFSILENMENIDKLLSRVWEYCYPAKSDGYKYLQTNEYFMFHHVAHMMYHFVKGGCGIKPFVDMCLLFDRLKYDDEIFKSYCDECGIGKFYTGVKELSNVWFGDGEHTELTKQMEVYLLTGGVYGTTLNHETVGQAKKGGKLKNIVSIVFLPYNTLVAIYPSLEGRRWLMPVYQVRRWFKQAFRGGLKRAAKKIKINQSVSSNSVERTNDMLDSLGIL